MKKLFPFVVLLFVSPNLFASAVLLEFTGTPSVLQNNEPLKLKSGAVLVDGVQLSADKKSSAQLMLESGAIIKVAGGQNYRVGDKQAKPQQTGFIQGIQIALGEVKQSGATPTVHGMIKMGPPATGSKKTQVVSSAMFGVAGTYPIHTAIVKPSGNLKIEWAPETKMSWEHPVLVLEDASKKQIYVAEVVPTALSHEICSCKAQLKLGQKYAWYLGQQTPERVTLRGPRYAFSVLSDAAAKALQADLKKLSAIPLETDFAKNLLKAQIYFKYGMVDEMMKILRPLYHAEENKADEVGEPNLVRDLLFLGAARMGLATEAELYR